MDNLGANSVSVDKHTVTLRFERAMPTYGQHAQVQIAMAKELVRMAVPFLSGCAHMLEIGCGTGVLTSEFLACMRPERFVANDLVDASVGFIRPIVASHGIPYFDFMTGDAESIELPDACHVVWSGATVQWFHDKASFFRKVADSLISQGVFAFSTFGPANFLEMRTCSGAGLGYLPSGGMHDLLSPCFDVLAFNEWTDTLWFPAPMEVLRHVKQTGVGGTSVPDWRRTQFSTFCSGYRSYFDPENGYPLTYHPMLFVCRKR
ncbi:MAG: methyltransferase domain-containing protein [Breznakibacter sp.]